MLERVTLCPRILVFSFQEFNSQHFLTPGLYKLGGGRHTLSPSVQPPVVHDKDRTEQFEVRQVKTLAPKP